MLCLSAATTAVRRFRRRYLGFARVLTSRAFNSLDAATLSQIIKRTPDYRLNSDRMLASYFRRCWLRRYSDVPSFLLSCANISGNRLVDRRMVTLCIETRSFLLSLLFVQRSRLRDALGLRLFARGNSSAR